jgi:hypothetical protein
MDVVEVPVELDEFIDGIFHVWFLRKIGTVSWQYPDEELVDQVG